MTADLPMLIEAQALADRLEDTDLLIVHVASAESYANGHVPGAVHLPPAALISGVKPATGSLPGATQLSEVFSALGLSDTRHVIAYDDEGGGWAGRLLWTLDVLGHNRYSYLNGGIHAWHAANLPLQTTAQQPRPTDYEANINAEPRAQLDFIVQHLNAANFAVWDARSKEEYDGSKVFAQRGGHIPGAVWYEWTDLMDRDANLRLLDLNAIRNTLAERGLTPDKTIVTHCQTHHRSGLTYLVARLLGYSSIKAYDGSWSEWGNRDDTPIET
ncbi:MAG: sulfurtransferase [Pseudomonadales bacterium]